MQDFQINILAVPKIRVRKLYDTYEVENGLHSQKRDELQQLREMKQNL